MQWVIGCIAKPIPMKRELKPGLPVIIAVEDQHCKAYPDEKGIETYTNDEYARRQALQSLSR